MAVALVERFKTSVGTSGKLDEIVLVPSGAGRYEIEVDGKLVYSKAATGEHISDQDAIRLIDRL